MGRRLQTLLDGIFGRVSLVIMTGVDCLFILTVLVLFIYLDKGKTWLLAKAGPLSLEGRIVVTAAEIVLDLILLVSVIGWLIKDVRCAYRGDCNESNL